MLAHLRQLAAARLCAGPPGGRPCLSCVPCRKVLDGVHPDVYELDPGEGREITVDRVRELRSDAFVRPFESQWKAYLILRAEGLNVHAQNALLKLLEEPPPYALFFLQTSNASALLPTVRSRCVLTRGPEALREADPEAQARGRALCGAFRKRDELAVASVLWSWDRLHRAELQAALQAFCEAERTQQDGGRQDGGVSADAMAEAVGIIHALDGNASVGICCAALCAKLARIMER